MAKAKTRKTTKGEKDKHNNGEGQIENFNKKDRSQYVFQYEKLKWEIDIRQKYKLTSKQEGFLKIITDKKTNIVFLKGPAGSSKSYLAVLAGLMILNKKTCSDILYIRSPIEVGKSIGYLKGDENEKVGVYLAPLYDKVDELTCKTQADALTKEARIVGTVPNFLRGQSWTARFVIVDEAQNMSPAEMKLIISRIGKHSKIIFLADEKQSDIRGNVEFMRYFDLFNGQESRDNFGIHCLSFDNSDIVRSPILSYLLDKIEGTYTPPEPESMF